MSATGPYAGISVAHPSPGAQALWWRLEEREGGVVVTLGGDVDENADFSDLRGQLHGDVVFELAEVHRINSCGVREWVNFHRDLGAAGSPVATLEYRSCSPSLVAQLNTISNFRGAARVTSFLAPYLCEACNREETRLVAVAEAPASTALPEFPCERCGAPLVFDDLRDRYLSFLKEI